MAEMGNIQWFPGHMTKTRRMIQSNLSLVDWLLWKFLMPEYLNQAEILEMDRLVKDKPENVYFK